MFPDDEQVEEEIAEKGKQADVSKFSKVDEQEGKLKTSSMDQKLMHSVLEGDKEKIAEGKLIEESLNRGMGAFNPSMMMEQLVKNFSMAKQIYGDSLLRQVTGCDADYLEKNIGIPEFQRELDSKVNKKMEQMKKDKVIDKFGLITDKGIELASVILYVQELDNILPKGISGDRIHKKHFIYGDKQSVKPYKKGDRYKDVAIKKSIKTAIRRGHENLEVVDLKTYERQSKGEVYIIYAMDSSGSMKGKKVGTCKKAGVSLAYQAIQRRDRVGLIVFGKEVKDAVYPTRNFGEMLNAITRIKAQSETDLVATIKKAIEMFPNKDVTRHLLMLTDALPTKGEDPEKETVDAASIANAKGITISIIGINLDEKGVTLAEKIVQVGKGKLYTVKDLDDIGKIVLEDYYGVF